MNKSYFLVAIRNIFRNKLYAVINLSGLAVGAAACLLIMLFVKSEWSFDKFHSKADRLYRLWLQEVEAPDQIFTETVTPIPLGPALKQSLPEIESTCRVYSFSSNLKTSGEKSSPFTATIVDESFFSLFDFELSEGNPRKPFPSSSSAIITKKFAETHFGKGSAIGKGIEVQLGDTLYPFIVEGIVDHVPEESSIQFDLLIPFSNDHYLWNENNLKAWHQIFPETYALFRTPVDTGSYHATFEAFAKQVLGTKYKPESYNLHLQPITDIHLNNQLPEGIQPISSPVYSYVLSTIGLLILLIACFNFITLSVGLSTARAREVGVRKVLGAGRKQLVFQFWSETFLFTALSVIVGLFLAFILKGPFNTLFHKELLFSFSPTLLLCVLLLIVFITLVAGMYPALILSGFNPADVFRGNQMGGTGKNRFRHVLIGMQFIASIALITCTLIVSNQMKYIREKDLGYKRENVIVVMTNKPGKEGNRLADLFRNELRSMPQVKSASVSLYTLAEPSWLAIGFTDKDKRYKEFKANIVDPDFLQTMHIELAAGHNFSADKSDAKTSGLINEALAKQFGMTNPIGEPFPGKFDATIIGVLKDFNYESLHEKVQPLMLATSEDIINRGIENISISYPPELRISVRMNEGTLSENIKLLESAWKKIEPVQNFDYKFLDESIASQYKSEQRTEKIIVVAAGLSIFIACLGLFGLATLVVNKRIKEIGIRKILGANSARIVALVSKEFILIVTISALAAIPLTWYAMNKWLEDFAYRITLSWWMFLLSTCIALSITLLTVGWKALQAAWVNPVNSLRTQ